MKLHTLILLLASATGLHAQSLLTTEAETSEQRTARELLAAPAQTRDAILNHMGDAIDKLWSSPNPQAVLDALGPKAGSLFAINQKFATAVLTLLTEEQDVQALQRLTAILAKIPAHTVNEDGTVTIVVPEPEPVPEE